MHYHNLYKYLDFVIIIQIFFFKLENSKNYDYKILINSSNFVAKKT